MIKLWTKHRLFSDNFSEWYYCEDICKQTPQRHSSNEKWTWQQLASITAERRQIDAGRFSVSPQWLNHSKYKYNIYPWPLTADAECAKAVPNAAGAEHLALLQEPTPKKASGPWKKDLDHRKYQDNLVFLTYQGFQGHSAVSIRKVGQLQVIACSLYHHSAVPSRCSVLQTPEVGVSHKAE